MGPGAILSKGSQADGTNNLYIAPQIKEDMSRMQQTDQAELMDALTRLGILSVGGNDSNMSLRQDDDQDGVDYSMPDASELYTEPQGQTGF